MVAISGQGSDAVKVGCCNFLVGLFDCAESFAGAFGVILRKWGAVAT